MKSVLFHSISSLLSGSSSDTSHVPSTELGGCQGCPQIFPVLAAGRGTVVVHEKLRPCTTAEEMATLSS